MTTPYAVSTNIGSMSYNNYVNAPITGPLSTIKHLVKFRITVTVHWSESDQHRHNFTHLKSLFTQI